MTPAQTLVAVGLLFTLVWAVAAATAGHSVVATAAWFVAVGALLGAAARLWWEGRR